MPGLPPPERPVAEILLAVPDLGDSPEVFTVTFGDGERVDVVASSYDVEGDDYVFRDADGAEVVRYPVAEVEAVAAA